MRKLDLNDIECVHETDMSKKLTIDGITETYQIYKIKLDCLYYNNQNGRIATWISKYESENGPLDLQNSKYNDTIHEMIVESNEEAFKKTKNNIRLYGQRESGVVLKDGRIVDGNRRFTCLRELSQEDAKFGYFEAVILDRSYDDGKKAIKSLELTLQHGTDKPVDYDPINKLVDVYNYLIKDGHEFTPKEFAKNIDQPESEVKKSMEVAKLMIEYLEFINAPEQFHLVFKQNIYGPLVDMRTRLKKIQDEELRETLKQSMFCAILYGKGDLTRNMRRYNKILESEVSPEFINQQNQIIDKVTEKIGNISEPMTQSIISEQILNDKDLENEIESTIRIEFDKSTANAAKSAPLALLDSAIAKLQAIDSTSMAIVTKRKDLEEKIETLSNEINRIKKCL